jgi:nucleoside-triphosphatase THEP1
MINIITGRRGVGKTTLLLKLVEEQKKQGSQLSGIMTPAIYDEDGNKVGFYAFDAANGDCWELGRSDKELDGPGYGPFSFNERGFTIANDILKKALVKDSKTVIIDEIGPLELEKGFGFFPVLSLISSLNQNSNLYLVIRSELIDEFIHRFISENEYKIIEITLENREEIDVLSNLCY